MITLFHRPQTRSTRFIFLLEELGAPYQIKQLAKGSPKPPPAPENPHPHNKVPAISDDGVVVFESSAIALYLTDKFPRNGIGPLVGDPKRGPYLTWLAYYSGVVEPAWTMNFMQIDVPPGPAGWAPVEEVMDFTFKTLGQGPYILGEKFSAADVLIGTTFAMFMGQPSFPKTPLVEDYANRVISRPAYKRALEKEGV